MQRERRRVDIIAAFRFISVFPVNCFLFFWRGELSARGPRLHPRSHLGRLHPAGSLSLRSAFGMLRRCCYLWRLIPAPASNTKPVIGPRRALARRSDGITDWSAPVSMTFSRATVCCVGAEGRGHADRHGENVNGLVVASGRSGLKVGLLASEFLH